MEKNGFILTGNTEKSEIKYR